MAEHTPHPPTVSMDPMPTWMRVFAVVVGVVAVAAAAISFNRAPAPASDAPPVAVVVAAPVPSREAKAAALVAFKAAVLAQADQSDKVSQAAIASANRGGWIAASRVFRDAGVATQGLAQITVPAALADDADAKAIADSLGTLNSVRWAGYEKAREYIDTRQPSLMVDYQDRLLRANTRSAQIRADLAKLEARLAK